MTEPCSPTFLTSRLEQRWLNHKCKRCYRKGIYWRKRMRPGHLTQGKQRKEIMDKAWGNIPLRRGSNLFSSTSRASVPSSIRSSLVMTPMVRWPTEKKPQTYLISKCLMDYFPLFTELRLATQGLLKVTYYSSYHVQEVTRAKQTKIQDQLSVVSCWMHKLCHSRKRF